MCMKYLKKILKLGKSGRKTFQAKVVMNFVSGGAFIGVLFLMVHSWRVHLEIRAIIASAEQLLAHHKDVLRHPLMVLLLPRQKSKENIPIFYVPSFMRGIQRSIASSDAQAWRRHKCLLSPNGSGVNNSLT